MEFIGQVSIRVAPDRIVEVCKFLRDDADARFNYLSDLTCVHYPMQRDRDRWRSLYNLYSISRNERVRLKAGDSGGRER